MTNRERTAKIKELKAELNKAIESKDIKRASFLQATINLYEKKFYN